MAEQRADGMSLLKGLKRSLPERGLPERGKVASEEDAERRILAAEQGVTPVASLAVAHGVSLDIPMDISHDTPLAGHLDAPLDPHQERHIDTTQERHLQVPQRTSLLKKKKTYTTTFTLRMDLDLYRRLKDVADFNELQMTAIINEAIGLHLAAFEQPPPTWKRRRWIKHFQRQCSALPRGLASVPSRARKQAVSYGKAEKCLNVNPSRPIFRTSGSRSQAPARVRTGASEAPRHFRTESAIRRGPAGSEARAQS